MTASGTAGHGDELAAYVDLVVARRGGGEVALGRPVGRQPGAPGARDPGGHDQQRRAPGPGRAGLARPTSCPRLLATGATGGRQHLGHARSRTTRRAAELLADAPAGGGRRRGQRVVPEPPRPRPDVRPRRPTTTAEVIAAASVCGRPRVGQAQPERHRRWPRSPRRPRGAAPRRSRWSTRCWAWSSTPRPAGPGSAAGAAGCRARPSTRSRCGRSTTCTAALPDLPDRRRRRRGHGRRRGRAAAGRRLGGAGRHGHLRRPPQRRAGARRGRGVVPGPRRRARSAS